MAIETCLTCGLAKLSLRFLDGCTPVYGYDCYASLCCALATVISVFYDGYTSVALQIPFRVPTVTLRFHIGYFVSGTVTLLNGDALVPRSLHYNLAMVTPQFLDSYTSVSGRLHFDFATVACFTIVIIQFHSGYSSIQ